VRENPELLARLRAERISWIRSLVVGISSIEGESDVPQLRRALKLFSGLDLLFCEWLLDHRWARRCIHALVQRKRAIWPNHRFGYVFKTL